MQLIPVMVLLAAGVTGDNGAASSKLAWSTHYGQARKTAQKVQRPLLIVLEDPKKPDAKFDDKKLASKDGQKRLLENYLLCRIDVTTPYGKKVKEAFHADALPYTAITDKTANYITFRGGDLQPNEWVEALSRHKEGHLFAPPHVVRKPAVQRSADAVISQPSYQFSIPSYSSGST